MNKSVFICNLNPYSNRKIIKYSNMSDYEQASSEHMQFNNINFNPNDGVNTEVIVNEFNDNFTPDYCVICELVPARPAKYVPVSRWFVMESVRLRSGQYKLTLRRDVVADHLDEILTLPCFVERGPLENGSPLVFNSEGFSLNQIKKSETLLKDESENAWIVGYIARSYSGAEEISSIFNSDTYPSVESLGIQLVDDTDITKGGKIEAITNDNKFHMLIQLVTDKTIYLGGDLCDKYHYYKSLAPNLSSFIYSYKGVSPNPCLLQYRNIRQQELFEYIENYDDFTPEFIVNDIRNILNIEHSEYTSYDNFIRTISNVTVTHNGRYYRAVMRNSETQLVRKNFNKFTQPAAYADADSLIQELLDEFSISETYEELGDYLGYAYELSRATLEFVEVGGPNQEKVTISNSRNNLDDAPYDMFCLPYSLPNLALAQRIAEKLTASNIYDLQILPYNPARYIFDSVPIVNVDYSPILDGNNVEVDKLYYCKHSSDTFIIEQEINVPDRELNANLNNKLSSECDYWRITSPNYSSSFEFNVAKNGGISAFRVDYTYRPVSPYIRVTPLLSGLYGDVSDDARGLILQGDFSIDTISDAWENYQVQNKNYENIFNTKIKSMDYQHQQNMISAGVGLGTSIARGAVGGMITGNVAGAVVGAAAGLTTGITNIATTENKFKDQRQVEVDMYNFQLGNVKALPDTLNKISAYNISNKYFPMVEYYTCSDAEVEMVKNFIKYRNYKQMRITTIGELPLTEELNFVKGQIIFNTIAEDDHYINEVYNEIYKGVYL